jgi:hypothetical protein
MEGKGGIGIKDRPSNKLGVVACVDCHRGVASKKKDTYEAIKKRCVECHDESYGELVAQWKSTSEELLKKVSLKMTQVKEKIDRIELRRGHTSVYHKLYGDAEFNYNLVIKGNGVHNEEYAEELLEYADTRLDEALKQLSNGEKELAAGKT